MDDGKAVCDLLGISYLSKSYERLLHLPSFIVLSILTTCAPASQLIFSPLFFYGYVNLSLQRLLPNLPSISSPVGATAYPRRGEALDYCFFETSPSSAEVGIRKDLGV